MQVSKYMESKHNEFFDDVRPKASFQRRAIYFPEFSLRVLNTLSDTDFRQLKETGWVREMAFKTEPHVTKVGVMLTL